MIASVRADRGPRRGRRAARAASALLVSAVILLAGCGGEDAAEPESDARPVTAEEAQLLAITRFLNYDEGSRPFHTEVLAGETPVSLTGWIDWPAEAGYAQAATSSSDDALLWTPGTVGVYPQSADADGYPIMPIPDFTDENWVSRPSDPDASEFDALLLLLGSLGSDRPDNPLLVQQTGALWLGEDEVDGTPVTVFAAPPSDEPLDGATTLDEDTSSLRLWLDDDGLMRRADLRLTEGWVAVTFPDQPGVRLELPEPADE